MHAHTSRQRTSAALMHLLFAVSLHGRSPFQEYTWEERARKLALITVQTPLCFRQMTDDGREGGRRRRYCTGTVPSPKRVQVFVLANFCSRSRTMGSQGPRSWETNLNSTCCALGAAGAIDGQAADQAPLIPPRRLTEASAPPLPVPFRRLVAQPIASHLRKKTPKEDNAIVLVAVLVLIL